ncbi:hypothetical protein FQZ97_412540 [compost metagenome]
MADLSELEGEVLALRCVLAALLHSLPLTYHSKVWPTFRRYSELVEPHLDTAAKVAFHHTVVRLSVRRPTRSDTGLAAVRGE